MKSGFHYKRDRSLFSALFLNTIYIPVHRLEHVDEILRSARLSGYLYIRTVTDSSMPSLFIL